MIPKQYVNQDMQIINGKAYCGAAVVAMITGENPQLVADVIGDTADDMRLVKYIRKFGHIVETIVDGGSDASGWAFYPTNSDFDILEKTMEAGKLVLYHFAGWDRLSFGHYALCVGTSGNDFEFWDPAGNRIEGYFNNNGKGAIYTRHQLRNAGIKRLWSIS